MYEARDDILSFCERHLQPFSIRNGQAVPRYCPYCNGGDRQDTDTFAISLANGAWNCMRGSCGKTGSFKDLAEFFGESVSIISSPVSKKKTYELPQIELQPLTQEAIGYFQSRRISINTLNEFKVSCDAQGNIIFPFYRDGKLVFAKIRKPRKPAEKEKKEWGIKNTEPILFGMDLCSFQQPLVICEGMIDALSLYEAGVTNVVSVPSGCNNLEFCELCWDWLEKFSQILLFGDNDQPGQEMVSTLIKRLGEDRCLIPPEYPMRPDGLKPCKDANEILYFYGPQVLKELADNAEEVPMRGVIDLADVPAYDPTSVPRVKTMIPSLDDALGGLQKGGVTVMTGKAGNGKSTLNGMLLLNAIEQGHKVCAYSGELRKERFFDWIVHQACRSEEIALKFDPVRSKDIPVVPFQTQQRIRDWVRGKFFLYDNNEIFNTNQQESIQKVFTMCARRYGCDVFLVDNMMIALSDSDEETKAQAKFAAALKAFAIKYAAAVILVAHPRKTKQGENLRNDDVSGASAITNLADNVIAVEKPNLRITKNRDYGITKLIECGYDPVNRRIFEAAAGDQINYSWNREGLIPPARPATTSPDYEIQLAQQMPF